MSSADPSGHLERMLLAAGTKTYRHGSEFPGALDDLNAVPRELQSVVNILTGLGYIHAGSGSRGYLLNPTLQRLRDAIRGATSSAPVVVVYYTGHGLKPERGPFYLLTTGSKPDRLDDTALEASKILDLALRRDLYGEPTAEQPQVLVILDCCYSGVGGVEALRDSLQGRGNASVWFLASAGTEQYSEEGRFAAALTEALQNPTAGPSQQFVGLEWIAELINRALKVAGVDQEARYFNPPYGSTGLPPFFPNPNYSPGLAGLTVADQHWLSRARGGPEESTVGFYLTGKTGRLRAAEHLAGWMTDTGSRDLAVVTGSPGTGKSALLALPVLLTDRSWRANLLHNADPGSLIKRTANLLPASTSVIAVHARGLNTDQVAGGIAQALGRESGSASALLEDLEATPEQGRRVLLVDAIDEAASPTTLLHSLLVPLAGQPGLRVAVGGRPHVLAGTSDADLTVDLDTKEYQDPQALTDYVYRLLTAAEEPGVTTAYTPSASAQGGQDDAAAAVAAAIAATAQFKVPHKGKSESFLIGRLLALSVRSRTEPVDIKTEGWQSQLPTSVAEAFDEDLGRLGNKELLARALLQALAWARGPGLPWENIWVPVARALAYPSGEASHLTISEEDVRWLLSKAGAYVVEDLGPGERSVYRPFHDLLAAHLRDQSIIEQTNHDDTGTEQIITGADAWQKYRQQIETAITHALIDTVPATRVGPDWEQAHPYLRTYLAQHARNASPDLYTWLMSDKGFLAVADPMTIAVTSMAYGMAPNGTILMAAGGVDGTVRVGDPSTAGSWHTLEGHGCPVTSVAFSQSYSEPFFLASADVEGTLQLWDPVARQRLGRLATPSGALTSVAVAATADGRPFLASSGSDGTVRLWDPIAGVCLATLTGHADAVASVAFGVFLDGRAVLATGSRDRTARLWDPATGVPVGAPLAGHADAVTSVAFGALLDGHMLLASASADGTVRLWDVGSRESVIVAERKSPVETVAFSQASSDANVQLAIGGEEGLSFIELGPEWHTMAQ